MLRTIFKKKVNEDKLANVLINSLLHAMEVGFKDISELINNDRDFVIQPNIKESDYDRFLLILFVGNLKIMESRLNGDQPDRLKELLIDKFSTLYDLKVVETKRHIKEYSTYMGRINYPSKNVLYAMSKAVFHKYNLASYQEEYFRDLNSPNPKFLKRLNKIVENFIWDWDYFLSKYNFVS
jgi:hypothetical protein|tara:strand:+ start:5443 stop:5985 length:543 start_codon:yes stop_codon:yes gene_type:complete